MKFKVGDRVKCISNGAYNGIKGKTGTVFFYYGYGEYGVVFDVNIKSLGISGKCENGYAWTCKEDMLELLTETAEITITRSGNTVTALNTETNENGIAKCNPSDTFDLYTGSRLALDRLFGKEIPRVREVKRAAKKGEWIKIVKAEFVPVNDDGTPSYENGDVLHIISDVGYGYVRFREGEDRSNKHYILAQSEYVVLENYTPSEPVEEPVKETFYNGKVVCIKAVPYSSFTVGKVYQFVDGSVTDDNGHKFPKVNDFEQWQRGSKGHTEWIEVKEEQEQKPSEKFYNGRVMCVDCGINDNLYTTGKIYEFVDGQLIDRKGSKFPLVPKHSFEEWQTFSSAKWLEIKE
jgi:hypothetical protein